MAASGWKLGGGLFLALVAGALATSPWFDNEPWSAVLVTAMLALPAALLIAGRVSERGVGRLSSARRMPWRNELWGRALGEAIARPPAVLTLIERRWRTVTCFEL